MKDHVPDFLVKEESMEKAIEFLEKLTKKISEELKPSDVRITPISDQDIVVDYYISPEECFDYTDGEIDD